MTRNCDFVLKSCIVYFHFAILLHCILFSYLRKFFVFSISGLYIFSNCKRYVGAGINTLLSVSDRLGPSIFCRKMEKARPVR